MCLSDAKQKSACKDKSSTYSILIIICPKSASSGETSKWLGVNVKVQDQSMVLMENQ